MQRGVRLDSLLMPPRCLSGGGAQRCFVLLVQWKRGTMRSSEGPVLVQSSRGVATLPTMCCTQRRTSPAPFFLSCGLLIVTSWRVM